MWGSKDIPVVFKLLKLLSKIGVILSSLLYSVHSAQDGYAESMEFFEKGTSDSCEV